MSSRLRGLSVGDDHPPRLRSPDGPPLFLRPAHPEILAGSPRGGAGLPGVEPRAPRGGAALYIERSRVLRAVAAVPDLFTSLTMPTRFIESVDVESRVFVTRLETL